MTGSKPVFHLLAGPNGAGKSTLYRALVASGSINGSLEFVNADLYEQAHLSHIINPQKRSEAARQWADARRQSLLNEKIGFVSETVFSHDSKLALITNAQAIGFDVVLHIVCVDNPKQLLIRIKQRVSEGGHHVPATRVLERYPRTMANLKKAVRLADFTLMYDGGDIDSGGPQLVATCEKNTTTALVGVLPHWAIQMINQL